MSVINDQYGTGWPRSDFENGIPKAKCTTCNGFLSYPFLEWRGGHQDLLLCSRCCEMMRPGLASDLIQLWAILDLQRFAGHNSTLMRASVSLLKAKKSGDGQ